MTPQEFNNSEAVNGTVFLLNSLRGFERCYDSFSDYAGNPPQELLDEAARYAVQVKVAVQVLAKEGRIG